MGAVRAIQLDGLGADDAQVLLAPKHLAGTGEQWTELNARFGGNGLALKVVGETIRELFVGDIGHFLEVDSSSSIFGGIRRVLAEQVDRSSPLEQQILRVLAVEREPERLPELHAALGLGVTNADMLEAVEALRHRSLVERAKTPRVAAVHPRAGFTLQSVVLEYVIERLVGAVAEASAAAAQVVSRM
jgi:hypothetical protein